MRIIVLALALIAITGCGASTIPGNTRQGSLVAVSTSNRHDWPVKPVSNLQHTLHSIEIYLNQGGNYAGGHVSSLELVEEKLQKQKWGMRYSYQFSPQLRSRIEVYQMVPGEGMVRVKPTPDEPSLFHLKAQQNPDIVFVTYIDPQTNLRVQLCNTNGVAAWVEAAKSAFGVSQGPHHCLFKKYFWLPANQEPSTRSEHQARIK